MSATHAHDTVFNEADDDDGMPPLVDNPNPSMTFTFATDMTPITYSTDPTSFELPPDNGTAEMSVYSPETSPVLGPIRISHAKKRDATYIPRPPNAFILFRSSFIHAQHIPGKIEGNHSALSKIIGKYWKALPREEREIWEAKAIVAQAEHRKRYPDWRFRPGANALAKVKDGPKRRSNKKGRGEAEKEERSREKRCAKIADLLVAGKKGVDLEMAVEEYDCKTGGGTKVKEEGYGVLVVKMPEDAKDSGPVEDPEHEIQVAREERSAQDAGLRQRADGTEARSKTPGPAFDARFKVPLTAMFKRSSSAPASHLRGSTDYADKPNYVHPLCHDVLHSSLIPAADMRYVSVPEHEGEPRVGGIVNTLNDGMPTISSLCVSTTQPSIPDFTGTTESVHFGHSHWHETHASSLVDIDCSSPPLPAFVPDTESFSSPSQSPLSVAANLSADGVAAANQCSVPIFTRFDDNTCGSFDSSYSSLTGWAGDAMVKHDPCNTPFSSSPVTTPFVYGSDGIMKEAFDAAASPFDWHTQYGLDVASPDYSSYRWNNFMGFEGLQSQGLQGLACRQDDPHLFK